jgi:ubiquitin C-terminal hydrolase
MSIDGESQNETDKMAIICYEKIKQMYATDYSEIWNIFYGIHVSQLHSTTTGEIVSTTPEPFFMVDLALPNSEENKEPTLIDCFDLYVSGEMIEGVFNEKTGCKETMKRTLKFWSLPNILVIDIKRFSFNRLNLSNKKKQNMMDFPLTGLDLSKYVVGYNKSSYVYDLYGVCNHSGGVSGGHYTAFVKNANGKWYLFNDTTINEIANTSHIISPKAYCFFYRKRI